MHQFSSNKQIWESYLQNVDHFVWALLVDIRCSKSMYAKAIMIKTESDKWQTVQRYNKNRKNKNYMSYSCYNIDIGYIFGKLEF